jgi:hypothetical protein
VIVVEMDADRYASGVFDNPARWSHLVAVAVIYVFGDEFCEFH